MSTKNASKKKFLKVNLDDVWVERIPLMISLFLFAFGMGMIVNGKKVYQEQLRLSNRVEYRATMKPFQK